MENRLGHRRICEYICFAMALICLLFVAALFAVSIFRTVVYVSDGYMAEYIVSKWDSGFLNIILLTVMACSSYLVYRACRHVSLKVITVLMLLWTLAVGSVFVYSASRMPAGDAEIIANAAYMAAFGNFDALSDYLSHHPFSMGLAFYEEVIFRVLKLGLPDITRGYCFMALQMFNVVLLSVSYYAVVMLCGALFKSEDIQKHCALLLMLFVPAMLLCTGINGRIPALCFSALSLYCFAYFAEYKKFAAAVFSAVFMGIALALKPDSVLVLAVILILWILKLLTKGWKYGLAALPTFFVVVTVVSFLPTAISDYRSEAYSQWENSSFRQAMGFDERETGALIYSGMYTAVSEGISGTAGIEKEHSESRSLKAFYHQWNDPEFHSIHINKISNHYRDTGVLYNYVCREENKLLPVFLNLFQSYLLLGAVMAVFRLLKQRDIIKLLPAVVFVGAAVLHLIFPADSSYVMKYYLLLLPAVSFGYCSFFENHWEKQDMAQKSIGN